MEFPSKTKVFLLVGNLSSKGFQGLGKCCLYLSSGEDIDHLFIHCLFSTLVWTGVLRSTNLPADWDRSDSATCLGRWTKDYKPHRTLTFFILLRLVRLGVIWGIWQSRNAQIFDHLTPDLWRTCNKIIAIYLALFSSLPLAPKNTPPRQLWSSYPVGFFDGASSLGLCGCGMVIFLGPESSYKFHWHCGFGTNTSAELLALRGILFCAS